MTTATIRKAVFPVGGLGTRFLPATKATPKEMLPIVDKPLIQYAVEEAVAAGVDTLIFVTGRNKRAIPDHFDKAYELEHELELKGKDKLLKLVSEIIPPNVDCIYIRQSEAMGLGHAVLCAEKAVGNEPFAVILADDLIDGNSNPCLKQMVKQFDEAGESVIAVETVDRDKTDQYGIVKVDNPDAKLSRIDSIVEKPKPESAPSNLGVVGRYILSPKIFELLHETGRGAGNEIQLTDAISALLAQESVNAYKFDGIRYDCGSKAGFLEANIEYGLQHPELREQLIEYLDTLGQRLQEEKHSS
ncbi:MAG: UTP--glucose-1-phosphate uridylyltransferase GalU [Candidatus Sedimenticola sp. (ex Thyasira tokunagai)]